MGRERKGRLSKYQKMPNLQPPSKVSLFYPGCLVYADASGYGIGAVLALVQYIPPSESDLTELHREHEVVIAYTSRHLDQREQDFPISDKDV